MINNLKNRCKYGIIQGRGRTVSFFKLTKLHKLDKVKQMGTTLFSGGMGFLNLLLKNNVDCKY
jgi:hypothetical protein